MGPPARRPAPLRRAGHADPRPGARADLWVHFAPPIGDAFRKSYRQAAALERRVPVREVLAGRGRAADPDGRDRRRSGSTATRSGSRSPGRSRSPTSSSRSRRAGSGSAAGSRTRAAGRAAARRCSTATRGARRARRRPRRMHRAGGGARAAPPPRRPTRRPTSPRPPRTDDRPPRGARRRPVRALVAALAPAAAAPALAAGRGLTIVSDATLRRRPRPRRVHVAVNLDRGEPPDRHEDPALLLRPGVPRGPAEHDRLQGHRPDGEPTVHVAADEGRPHAAPDRLRQAARRPARRGA